MKVHCEHSNGKGPLSRSIKDADFIVPKSQGSSFCRVTRNPRLSIRAPMEAAANPFPRDERTPPVMKINFVWRNSYFPLLFSIRHACVLVPRQGSQIRVCLLVCQYSRQHANVNHGNARWAKAGAAKRRMPVIGCRSVGSRAGGSRRRWNFPPKYITHHP